MFGGGVQGGKKHVFYSLLGQKVINMPYINFCKKTEKTAIGNEKIEA